MKHLKCLMALLALSSLMACSKSVEDTAKDKRNVLAIAGNWNYGCSQTGLFGNFKSQKEEYHFGDDSSFQRKYYFFSDTQCQTPSFVRIEDGLMTYQGNDSVRDGVAVDFSFSKVSLVPNSPSAVNELNALNYCGVNAYVLGQATDVTPQSSNALCIGIKHTPRTTYDLVKLIDDNHLNLNGNADEEDSSKRLVISNTRPPLVRQ